MDNLQKLSLEDFSLRCAEDSPAPGGGSVSALAGALCASLAQMVAKLSLNKKSLEPLWAGMTKVVQDSETLRQDLLKNVTKDSLSFDGFMKALALPKNTDEEKRQRTEAMQEALKGACEVPLDTAKASLQAMRLALDVLKDGSAGALSDGLVGLLLGHAAVRGATANIRLNLTSIKDEAFCALMRSSCEQFETDSGELQQKAFEVFQMRLSS